MSNQNRFGVIGSVVFAAAALFLLAGVSGCVAPSVNAPTLATPLAATLTVAPAAETPTATPQEEVAAVHGVSPENVIAALAGAWGSEDVYGPMLEILSSGAYTLTHDYGDEAKVVFTGTLLLEDGNILIEHFGSGLLTPHDNLLLLSGYWPDSLSFILHRISPDGTLQPFQPVGTIELPALAGSMVTSMTIVESWTGLSPVAPIEATFHLTPAPQALEGFAHFSAAGYRDPITATAPISIPMEVFNQFLATLAITPLEEGPYQPLINHTDDYPSIALIVETSVGRFTFETQSQGENHVPWKALIEGREYVTYAVNPAQAWRLLDPYLARPIQTALIEQAE